MNSNQDKKTQAGTLTRKERERRKRISGMKREFRFAVDCLKAVLHDNATRWKPKMQPLHLEPLLCSPDIIRAIHHLVSDEMASAIDIVFHSWFDDDNLTFPKFKKLVDMLATNYCDSPVTARKYLEFCCTVAEISAMMYIGGFHGAPDYGIMSIFYCTLHSIDERGYDGRLFVKLEQLATKINHNHSHKGDPLGMMLKNRQRILSEFDVAYFLESENEMQS